MYKKFPPEIKKLCHKAFERIRKNPLIGISLIFALKGYYSFRTSSYRIIYKIEARRIKIIVVAIGHRREVYDKLKRILSS